jgi:hypothetical protein
MNHIPQDLLDTIHLAVRAANRAGFHGRVVDSVLLIPPATGASAWHFALNERQPTIDDVI